MSAMRRQLSATGWQAVGFFGASLAFAVVVVLWGHHIEGRIDTVVIQRHHDHRVLHRLVVHDARVAARSESAPATANSNSREVGEDGTGGSGGAPAPAGSNPKSPAKPGHPRHESASAPPDSGSEEGAPPTSSASPNPTELGSPPPEPKEDGGTLGSTEGQGTVPKVVEATGEVVGDVQKEVLTPTLCLVRGLLQPCP
jgi:hypothetical protein